MNMDKFLENVALHYISAGPDHRGTTLVFPNKRSSLFMRRYLKRNARGPMFMPRMVTIGSLFSTMSDLVEADRLEQLFTLYDAYIEVECAAGQTPKPFERFRFWGEMMLDDFDDVDRQLASPDKVFGNLADLKEIRTDYLTDQQRLVALELWGYDPAARFENFWSHFRPKDENDEVFDGYRTLSEQMLPIYRRFGEMLAARGLTTRGAIARNAAQHIVTLVDTPDALPQRLGFVGFGVLTRSEQAVFDALKKAGRADFFWDEPTVLRRDMPDIYKGERLSLAKYVAWLKRRYPMPDGFEPSARQKAPAVDIVSVPSNTMQAKVAGNILQALSGAGMINASRADSTAIVVPDPALLVPVLHALPPNIHAVNVTMGLPVRHTPFATLLSAIISARMASRIDKSGTVFITEHVARILTHPSMSVIAADETRALRIALEKEPRYITPYSTIVSLAPSIAFIFAPVDDENTADAAITYLTALIDGMTGLISRNTTADTTAADTHELSTLAAFRNAITSIVDKLTAHREITPDLDTGSLTFFRMVEKILYRDVLNLSGSPLRGVQIMGVLETRSLDFDNVIMLSLNEKTFPPKQYLRSLIPAALRAAYGLSTVESRELEYTWIFYNLLGRSRRVFLTYNAAADEDGTGGKSRYLFQVENLFDKLRPSTTAIYPTGKLSDATPIIIDKNNETVRAELQRFMPGGDLNLSASALKHYMACPLQFYLSNVKGVTEARKPTESVDSAVQGNIIHASLQNLFDRHATMLNQGMVDAKLTISPDQVMTEVAMQLDKQCYFGHCNGNIEFMPGEGRMLAQLYTDHIVRIIELEKKRGPYRYIGSEVRPGNGTDKTFLWNITPRLTVRFTFSIDRLDDPCDGTLRFVDYKTGSDVLEGGSLDDIFHHNDNRRLRNDALFQLLTYAHAYNDMHGSNTPVRIEITKVFNPEKSIGCIPQLCDTDGKKCRIDTHLSPVADGFRPMLADLISDIFDTEKPFVQTDNIEDCRYCQFANICHRVTD